MPPQVGTSPNGSASGTPPRFARVRDKTSLFALWCVIFLVQGLHTSARRLCCRASRSDNFAISQCLQLLHRGLMVRDGKVLALL